MNKGKIVQVIGPVVDVRMSRSINFRHLQRAHRRIPVGGNPVKLTSKRSSISVTTGCVPCDEHHQGLKRGCEVLDTGNPSWRPSAKRSWAACSM